MRGQIVTEKKSAKTDKRRQALGLWLLLTLGGCAPLTGIYLLQGSGTESHTVPTVPPDEAASADESPSPGDRTGALGPSGSPSPGPSESPSPSATPEG